MSRGCSYAACRARLRRGPGAAGPEVPDEAAPAGGAARASREAANVSHGAIADSSFKHVNALRRARRAQIMRPNTEMDTTALRAVPKKRSKKGCPGWARASEKCRKMSFGSRITRRVLVHDAAHIKLQRR